MSEEVEDLDKSEQIEKEDQTELTGEDLATLGWSEARINAFLRRKENPNAYFYRFNAPGEAQLTGDWSQEENEKFLSLLREGIDYRWGIFSKSIPGRVGYQCSNYYRTLIQQGQIKDPNYSIVGGKLRFNFKKKTEGEKVFPIIVVAEKKKEEKRFHQEEEKPQKKKRKTSS